MITGLDTNIVVRYLVQDDPKQAALATRLFEKELSQTNPGFLSHIVMCELVWVLEDCYGLTRPQIVKILEKLFSVKQILLQGPDLAWRALQHIEKNDLDFSDVLISLVNKNSGCERLLTFDKQAAKSGHFELLR